MGQHLILAKATQGLKRSGLLRRQEGDGVLYCCRGDHRQITVKPWMVTWNRKEMRAR